MKNEMISSENMLDMLFAMQFSIYPFDLSEFNHMTENKKWWEKHLALW